MLEAMARVAPSQPNEAMARIASRRNSTISLDPASCRVKTHEKGSFKSVAHGHRRKCVGYLTGGINAGLVLKVLTSEENRERSANSGRVVAQGLFRFHRVEILPGVEERGLGAGRRETIV
jgi:hypothetical protein